jgi:hypothetical protein
MGKREVIENIFPFSWEIFLPSYFPENKIMGIREVIGSYFTPRNLHTLE